MGKVIGWPWFERQRALGVPVEQLVQGEPCRTVHRLIKAQETGVTVNRRTLKALLNGRYARCRWLAGEQMRRVALGG